MLLSELVNGDKLGDLPNMEISGLAADSRDVRPGFLFAALSGARANGADFIDDAIRHGAVAILAAPDVPANDFHVTCLTDANPRHRLAIMASRFYPGQPETVAAVTGTNGKTSVANFTRQIWAAMGYGAASLGTLGVQGGRREIPLKYTTPEPVLLHRLLSELERDGVDHLAVEASSHGLDQNRLDGVKIRAAGFTNLSRDHLDYHQSPEDYLAAKLRLFEELLPREGTAVINADCEVSPALLRSCREGGQRLISYGCKGRELRLVELVPHLEGQVMRFELFGRAEEVDLPLVGAFQAMNILCALGLVIGSGGDAGAAVAALSKIEGVPGRVQKVARHSTGAVVYVDYAHSPDALENLLNALRPHTEGRLVVVFGCGGDRDRGKRPVMGAIARRLADRVYVTDDNPRSEDPALIRREVLAGCEASDENCIEIGDREAAIRAAVAELAEGDLLVLAGKGHEQGQIIGDQVRPFDDMEVARRALEDSEGRRS